MSDNTIVIVEARRSKGVFKADLTTFSKEDIKKVLEHYKSTSYVAVRNYRSKAEDAEVIEIKFHKLGAKGTVKYSLKTILTKDDLKAIGFVPSPKGNLHLTEKGNSLDEYFDVEVKEPIKKITSAETKAKAKAEKAEESKKDNAGKKPLPPKKSTKVEDEDDGEDENEDEDETPKTVKVKKPLPLK